MGLKLCLDCTTRANLDATWCPHCKGDNLALEDHLTLKVAPAVDHERTPVEGDTLSAPAPAPAQVRAWARANGWDLPARGRIPQEVLAAYEHATGG